MLVIRIKSLSVLISALAIFPQCRQMAVIPPPSVTLCEMWAWEGASSHWCTCSCLTCFVLYWQAAACFPPLSKSHSSSIPHEGTMCRTQP